MSVRIKFDKKKTIKRCGNTETIVITELLNVKTWFKTKTRLLRMYPMLYASRLSTTPTSIVCLSTTPTRSLMVIHALNLFLSTLLNVFASIEC